MSFQDGWGRGTWGLGSWGTPLYVNVNLTGIASTVGLGDPIVNAGAVVQVTSVGVITSALAGVDVIARAIVYPASQVTTSALGTPQVVAAAVTEISGLQINSANGAVAVIATAVVSPIGLSAQLNLRPPLVYGEIDTAQVPGYATIDTSQSPGYIEIPPARDAA